MFRVKFQGSIMNLLMAGLLLSIMEAPVFADSVRHYAKSSKDAAPTQEDHAAYFSGLEVSTPEKMQQADGIRQKTIASIQKLMASKKNKLGMFELYLRLGELHSERADYLSKVEIEDWEKRYDGWQTNGKKAAQPTVDNKGSRAELLKSAEAFRRLVTEYPTDKRTDAALFALAKTLGRLDNENAVLYFNQLLKSHPQSSFIPMTHLALGEYYFDKHNVPMAIQSYKNAMKFKDSKAYPYAVYKLGWCYYNSAAGDDKQYEDNTKKALAAFKLVVKLSEEAKADDTVIMNLKREATRDLIMVWADTAGVDEAWDYFSKRNEKDAFYSVLERLGNIYVDQGKNKSAIEVYSRLLKEAPNREQNADIYVKLVKLKDEDGDVKGVVETLEIMNQTFVLQSSWTRANADKKAILDDARTATEHNLHRLGTLFHSRGQKQNRKEYQEAAANIYKIYLTSFPKSETAYEIRYYLADIYASFKRLEEASTEYTKVVLEKQTDGKYLKDSAFNAVATINELDQQQKYDKLPPAGKVEAPMEIPRVKKLLLGAIDNYTKVLPKEAAGQPMRFTAAQIYFAYGHYDIALKRFEELGLSSPASKQGQTAVKVILTYYTEKKDWDSLVKKCRTYLDNKALMAAGLQETVRDSLKNGVFQKASQLEKDGQHEKAAQAFVAFQKEFSDDKSADRALYNATLNYYKIAKVDEALKIGVVLIKAYPKSELVPQVQLDMAMSYEALADFENAGTFYRDFAISYPNDKSAAGALFNAATLYKGMNKVDEAARLFERFTVTYPKNELQTQALRELANIFEKKKDYQNAAKYYERYANAVENDVDNNLYARAKFAQLNYVYLAKDKGEREINKLQRLLTTKNGPAATEARQILAELLFKNLEDNFKRFKDVHIRSADSLQKDVRLKQSKLLDLANQYETVIDVGNGEYTVAALFRLGEMHENFAAELFKAPAPVKASQVEIDQFKSSIEKVAFPLKEESMKFFDTAYKRSVEVQTFSEWTKRAYEKMAELDPEKHPEVDEKSTEPMYMSHRMEWQDAVSKLVND